MGGLPGPTIDLNLTVRIAGLPGSAAERHRRATPGTHQDSIRIAFLRRSPAGVEARQPRRFASSATVTGVLDPHTVPVRCGHARVPVGTSGWIAVHEPAPAAA